MGSSWFKVDTLMINQPGIIQAAVLPIIFIHVSSVAVNGDRSQYDTATSIQECNFWMDFRVLPFCDLYWDQERDTFCFVKRHISTVSQRKIWKNLDLILLFN